MTPELLGALTLFVGVPLNLLVAVLAWLLSWRSPELGFLRERAVNATFVLLIVATFGLIFWNNDRPIPPLSLADTKWITRAVMFSGAIVLPTLWLWIAYGRALVRAFRRWRGKS